MKQKFSAYMGAIALVGAMALSGVSHPALANCGADRECLECRCPKGIVSAPERTWSDERCNTYCAQFNAGLPGKLEKASDSECIEPK